ncbi:MAG: Na/Pi cotransporter family protein [Boseongicola sp.]|nr:Na/Pi cotransporter family protein [Boseongicola sp.]
MLIFLLSLGGAVALLIWAVRLVRTGVERGFSNQLRFWLRHSEMNRFISAGTGLGAAVLLQSSTAVAVMTSGFIAKRGLAAATGLAILLGADVGSAIVSQILVVRLPLLIPLLLLFGVAVFSNAGTSTFRQVGRVLIGLALIFVSLDMIRAATGPLVADPATQTVMSYLSEDLISAFLIGAIFAWLVHSSVAAVLFFVTLAGQGVLPPIAAASMILGANLGGAFIAYFLTISSPVIARRVVIGNLAIRGSGAALAAAIIAAAPELLETLGTSPDRQAINLHLAFNVIIAVLALPFVSLIMSIIESLVPDKPVPENGSLVKSALDDSALDRPRRGLDCVARELLGMGQKIENMLLAVEPLYDAWDADAAQVIRAQNKAVGDNHLEVKLYLARLAENGLDEELSKRSMELASISTSLVSGSDAISRIMVQLAKEMHSQNVRFSERGREEIGDFSDRVQNNVQLALNVMLNQNPAEARELVAAKEKVRKVERKLQRKHLERLRDGLSESMDTSNIHQETLRALKQINTAFSMVGYPILEETGDLMKSRLA